MCIRDRDYGWSEEGNRILNWGIEGESYEFVDGWPKLTDSIVNNDQGIAPSEAFGVYRNLNGPYPVSYTHLILISAQRAARCAGKLLAKPVERLVLDIQKTQTQHRCHADHSQHDRECPADDPI